MIEITQTENGYFVCKKDAPYHRTGKAGVRACSMWTKEDFEQMREFLNQKEAENDGSEVE